MQQWIFPDRKFDVLFLYLGIMPVNADASSQTSPGSQQQPSHPEGGAQSHPPNPGNATTCLWYTIYVHSRVLGMITNHVVL